MRKMVSILSVMGIGIFAVRPASGETLEAVSRRSMGNFTLVQSVLGTQPRSQAAQAEDFHAVIAGQPIEKSADFKMTNLSANEVAAQSGKTPIDAVDLGTLHNRHLKTTLSKPLSGETVYISGTFDREQNAFITAWPASAKEPKIFNIKGLMDAAGKIQAGGAAYDVYLEANPLKPLKSKIVFENKADEDDVASIRIGNLLEGVEAAGHLVQLTGQAYRLFYFDGIKEDAAGASFDPSQKAFAMILKQGDDMHVFLIPDETIPSDKIALFTMHENKRVGLRKSGGKLEIYENP